MLKRTGKKNLPTSSSSPCSPLPRLKWLTLKQHCSSDITEIPGYQGWDLELCIPDFSPTLSRTKTWVPNSYKPLSRMKIFDSEQYFSPHTMISAFTGNRSYLEESALFKLLPCIPFSTCSPRCYYWSSAKVQFSYFPRGMHYRRCPVVLSQLLHALLKLFQVLRVSKSSFPSIHAGSNF